ncbi:bacteriophage abortive infection AbiH family protein [Lactobacillus helveticus]|uniref:bacteriophage abortive infection AbiH family protein n=1 Tax=Lactobacillus helveticus TaxID=1587 RepID=UPI0021822044|nr:bacteriophage abortive infection AbiH family protein [Lactobacillus helveticus]
MAQNVVSRLLVIGNGFDLKCDLKSKFEDYYNNKDDMVKTLEKMNADFNNQNTDKKILQDDVLHITGFPRYFANLNDNMKINFNDKNISFWDFYFYFHKGKLNNWADVESCLNNLLTIKSHKTHPDLEKSLDMIARLEYLRPRLSIKKSYVEEFEELKENFTVDRETLVLLFVLLNNLKYDIEKHSERYLYDFLFDELNKFEKSFNDYLKTLQNEKYKEKSQQLLNKLSSNERYNLLSFNYTTPCTKDSSCNIKRNIHGKLEDHPIIGIDSKNISSDSPVFRFTKTYRIMTLASEKQDKLLPQTVKTIVFYGHSLAPADYSYFQSIFDYYNIYDNDITLVFYYSIYDESKEQKIKRNQFNSVSKLMYEYGTTFHNEKGKNLMHKMLLEGRLILKKLE